MRIRRRWRQFEVFVKLGLAERAAQLFRRFGHDGLPFEGWQDFCGRGFATPAPERNTRISLHSNVTPIRASGPGHSTRIHQDPVGRSLRHREECAGTNGLRRERIAATLVSQLCPDEGDDIVRLGVATEHRFREHERSVDVHVEDPVRPRYNLDRGEVVLVLFE
jgi:hypothetical protein